MSTITQVYVFFKDIVIHRKNKNDLKNVVSSKDPR